MKAVLNYTAAEALADADPDAALDRLRTASLEVGRCRPSPMIRAEEMAVLHSRIVSLKQQIKYRLRWTDEFFKMASGLLKVHRLATVANLLNTASPDLYLHQMRFEAIRARIVADSHKAFDFVQIGHSYWNRKDFKKAKQFYEEALKFNREYPKLQVYLEQARYRAAQSRGFLWGLF